MSLNEQEQQRLVQALGVAQRQPVEIHSHGRLGKAELVELLQGDAAALVVEDYISPPEVVPSGQRFDFWKREIKTRLVEPDVESFYREDFPGEYCYTALLCTVMPAGERVVFLRKHH